MKRTKSKASRGLVTWRIVYLDRKHPHGQPRELKVDVRRGEVIDEDYAAAMVAARTTAPLADVTIVKIVEPDGSLSAVAGRVPGGSGTVW